MSEILGMGLTPRKIAQELDRFIVGQADAKKAVALALRNRMRRKMVAQPMRDEIVPKNILMVGPTGVGKTEIARRLAKLTGAPFIKVEATKFTEVGYVGRDVESIIRDLLEIAINNLKVQEKVLLQEKALEIAIDKVVDILASSKATDGTKEKFREKILSGQIDNTQIEVELLDNAPSSLGGSFMEIPGLPGAGMGMINIGDMLKGIGSKPRKRRKMSVRDAIVFLSSEEADNLLDHDKIIAKSIELVENDGIVFLDEIDKIASRGAGKSGAEVSREGVQRDLLPLIEGTSVNTKYGSIKTDHILFIASGAFHLAKPSDLLPELQGRLPIRVELQNLSKDDMVRVLTEPESSLLKQYKALLSTEGLELIFEDDAIDRIAVITTELNNDIENIGARRLHTILEKLLEEISFNASDIDKGKVVIDVAFVEKHLASVTRTSDLSRFIL